VGWLNGPLPWIVLLAAALCARLAFAFILPQRLMWPDPVELEAVARLLYEKGTYGLQTLRPPGYPTFIAGVYHLFGPNLITLRLVEAALATVSVGLIGALGVRLFGRRAGLLGMAIAALHPMLAFLPSTTYSESTSVLLFVSILTLAYSATERGGAWRWALVGVLLGLLALVRPNAIALLPGLGLGFGILLHRRRRAWLVPVLVTGLAFGLTVLPWIVRNHRVHQRWYYVSTGGGRQVWLGNNPNATCVTTDPLIIDDVTKADLDRLPTIFDDDRYLYGKAMEFIRSHPGRAAQLYLVKLGNIFALFPETMTGTYVNWASRLTQGIASIVIFVGCLLALRRWKSVPEMWPLVGATLTFVFATALAFSSVRYRMLVEPCLILIAGVGWSRHWPEPARGPAPAGSNAPPRLAA
jgi:4-amino-4-deoxy-L-arabinose transferase-like glycosyltransferase